MNVQSFKEEKDLQLEKDAAAFASLTPRQRAAAIRLGNAQFFVRRAMALGVIATMKPFDWLYEGLCRQPFLAIRRVVTKNRPPVEKKPRNAPAFWRKAKVGIGKVSRKVGDFLGRYGAVGLYRVTEWVLNPRTRAGKPVFTNPTLNKVLKIGGGLVTLVAMTVVLGGIELLTKIGHVEGARMLAHSTASPMALVGQQFAIHMGLNWASYAAQFLVVPSIAATRQVLKEFKIFQGMGHHYNARMRAWREKNPDRLAKSTHWTPSGSMVKLGRGVLVQASPEFYRARMKYYLSLDKKASAPVAAPQVQPVNQKPSTLGNKTVGPAFNDNAPKAPGADDAPNAPKLGPDLKP